MNRPEALELLKQYLSKDLSLIEICKKYNIKWRTSISRWKISIEKYLLCKHQTNKKLDSADEELLDLIIRSKQSKKARKFSKQVKEAIIKEYYKTGVTKANIARKYKISSGLMSSWILNYEANIDKSKESNLNLLAAKSQDNRI